MRTPSLNYALYQVGWLAAILGTAAGHEALGAAVAATCLLLHLTLTREPAAEGQLLLSAVIVGTTVEVVHRAVGIYDARPTVLPSPFPPLWLVILWAQFATTFRYCLRSVLSVAWRAAVFGAVGGPLAFWAASRLGALTLNPPVARGLIVISATWTVALLVFAALVVRRHGVEAAPAYRYDRR